MESLARTAAGIFIALSASATMLTGTYALVGGTQHAYARAIVSRPEPGKVTLDVTQSNTLGGPPLRNYELDMTKLMHMIAISDDFTQFMHVHPSFNRKTGAFRQTLDLSPAHSYYVYVDSQPAHSGQQVFRFVVPSLTRQAPLGPVALGTPSPHTTTAGTYQLTLAKTTLPAKTMQMVALDITKDGKPAADLTPYLGAAGHAVFINAKTFEYVHVHPLVKGASDSDDMGDMPHMKGDMAMNDDKGAGKAGPHLMMHVPALPAGSYKLWFQFQGGGTLYTAPFTIVVQ